MAYNFKSIADVEVVAEPTETANVLIEEDGVIKKAPKTAVGGGGSAVEPDMVITVAGGRLDTSLTSSYCTVTEGSASAINAKLSADEVPVVKVRYNEGAYGDYNCFRCEFDAFVTAYGEGYWVSCMAVSPGGVTFFKLIICIDANNNVTSVICSSII